MTRFGTLIERIRRLDDWGHEILHRNVVTIGREDEAGVPLADYLDAVSSVDRGKRFDAMVASNGLDRYDQVNDDRPWSMMLVLPTSPAGSPRTSQPITTRPSPGPGGS